MARLVRGQQGPGRPARETGSTESPYNAWFAGFAADPRGRAISIAVVVEGGQHGSTDAAPLAKEIIRFCADAGYIGEPAK